jgi:translocation and assembly module TamB
MKWLKWSAVGLAATLVIAIAFLLWVLNAESGARWAAGVATRLSGEKLAVGAVEGTIAGPLRLAGLRYRDPAAGIDVAAERIAIDIALAELRSATVRVNSAQLDGVDVRVYEGAEPKPLPQESQPFSLKPPIDVVIDALSVNGVTVHRDAGTLLALTTTSFVGHWTHADLAVRRLDVRSPQGEVHFAGRVAQHDVYSGEGDGRFRWSVGDRTYAGSLRTVAQGQGVNLALRVERPMRAQLDAFLEQSSALPWRFVLSAPRFDPREELLPGSSLQSLGVSLQGTGTLAARRAAGTIRGRVLINDEWLNVDPLHFTRDEQQQTVSIESALRIGELPGRFRARAAVEMSQAPWIANVHAQWRDMVIPKQWAGQELHTRGDLDLHGNPHTFTAKGALSLGPADRVADIALDVRGTPDTVDIGQFDIVQRRGRLDATGKVHLQPTLAWSITARSQRFDPGAFAVAWPGALSFDLSSEGRMTPEGPAATLRLENLKGDLRGRRLTGEADLVLTPPLIVAGTLSLQSGESDVKLRGRHADRLDASLSFDVASLNDLLPDSGGQLAGQFRLAGRWPEVSIDGEAHGHDLSAGTLRIDRLRLTADVDEPLNPRGTVHLDLTRLAAAGLRFETVAAHATGVPGAHELTLHTSGAPLALDLAVKGGRTVDGWSGSVQQLKIDVQDAARLALREPVRIAVAKSTIRVSQACLAGGEIEMCARGDKQADGTLHASYSLAGVPLALADVFAPADMPLKFSGVIEGRGDLRRTAAGELFGDARIRSPSGGVSRVLATTVGDASPELQTLLSYTDLNIAANLSGPDARASLNARLDQQGLLDGEATLQGLGAAETGIEGRLAVSIPDLAPLGLFAPQLANVHGRADAHARVTGTLQTPEISGELKASELAADIPAVGLHLKEGALQVRPAAAGAFDVSGGVRSGEGRVEFTGVASPAGALELKISGERFLAADIPGARVTVAPALTFARAQEGLSLKGSVTIPAADVNLQKLPRGDRAQKASSDVVVVDATMQEEEAAKSPLSADVTVILGDEVNLTGFGLVAKLNGRLAVRETPGEPTAGTGEVRVSGTYKAYGQDLTIRQGQLLYARTPLDNPRLNVEAIREVDDVTAGLRVRGSAQSPELTVFSDPPMAQANALAYLVTGKPLEDIGAGEEGDAMQAATRTLGTAAGGLLAKNVGRRMGVDEVSVKENEMIGGAALTVGQYLSPRLYVSYGVGLFEPGDVVTLRYKLTKELAAKAESGPEDTRAGIEYRIEK